MQLLASVDSVRRSARATPRAPCCVFARPYSRPRLLRPAGPVRHLELWHVCASMQDMGVAPFHGVSLDGKEACQVFTAYVSHGLMLPGDPRGACRRVAPISPQFAKHLRS